MNYELGDVKGHHFSVINIDIVKSEDNMPTRLGILLALIFVVP